MDDPPPAAEVVVVSGDGVVVPVVAVVSVVVVVAPDPAVVAVVPPGLASVVVVDSTDRAGNAASELSVTLWITVWRTTVGSPSRHQRVHAHRDGHSGQTGQPPLAVAARRGARGSAHRQPRSLGRIGDLRVTRPAAPHPFVDRIDPLRWSCATPG